MTRLTRTAATAGLLFAATLALVPTMEAAAQMTRTPPGETTPSPAHPYVGMWATPDGHIRQELLPNGRYDEARGTRASAYRGRYAVSGNRIDYWDDTGFTADGTFVDEDTLHHGGMIFRRQR